MHQIFTAPEVLGSVIALLVGILSYLLARIKKATEETRRQVTNTHKTNLRDDIDANKRIILLGQNDTRTGLGQILGELEDFKRVRDEQAAESRERASFIRRDIYQLRESVENLTIRMQDAEQNADRDHREIWGAIHTRTQTPRQDD
ncbi:DUF2746 domain-containing protein [Varibaculum cambriense]|uniref:DUF2746 domain-containing protein n=1 Tax=Varibaculum cambriense TaxID=184870 RepID=UPI00241E54EB|nr:DUF2746 domain-containing protein [Varibaculum cambriense]MBS5944864.1 DUF2746 domain-containing protein [Varibaculum cambriense]